jgi:heme/copper-type cytochrome/quinol oxidase subunit 2
MTDYNKKNNDFKNEKSILLHFNVYQEIKHFSHSPNLIILLGISFALIYTSGISHISNASQVFAQPAPDYPIPDSSRMFTNDTAIIKKFDLNPYVLDLAMVPKNPVAGKPVLFVLNFFDKATKTWLWHSDLRVAISDPEGKPIAVFPNNHGHGSVIEFEYIFPKNGTYNIDLLFGQQTGSPNFIVEPKVIRQMDFNITVSANNETSVKIGANNNSNASKGIVKDISIKAESWKFTPNVIEVNKGDLVRLHFAIAQDEVALYNGHGFGIEGYNVNAFLLKGTQQTVEFIADKPGTFTFRCTSFCSAPEAAIENHFNMVGKLVVH